MNFHLYSVHLHLVVMGGLIARAIVTIAREKCQLLEQLECKIVIFNF